MNALNPVMSAAGGAALFALMLLAICVVALGLPWELAHRTGPFAPHRGARVAPGSSWQARLQLRAVVRQAAPDGPAPGPVGAGPRSPHAASAAVPVLPPGRPPWGAAPLPWPDFWPPAADTIVQPIILDGPYVVRPYVLAERGGYV